MRTKGLSYSQAERKALEQAAETGTDRWVVAEDDGWSIATSQPPPNKGSHLVTVADAQEQMCLEPTTPPMPSSSGTRKVGKIRQRGR
jgi:hypothetical protein